MAKLTFSGGIHPSGKKNATKDKPLVELAAPEVLYFPLGQHIGAPLKPLVSVGDRVLKMQKIADAEAFVSAPLHSSVSGKVKDIGMYLNHTNSKVLTIVIENDGLYEEAEPIHTQSIDDLSPNEMRRIIREAGIVGMGGAGFPTHVKLSPPEDKEITHLIVNAAECEPYLTSDRRVMLEMTDDIIGGLKCLMRLLNLSKCYVGIEDNAPEAIALLEEKVKGTGIEIKVLKKKYPQGSEKQIINAICGKEVPMGKLPMDVGCIVINIGTVAEIYRALAYGIPLHRRIVTVSGDAISNPSNLYVPLGTPFSYLVDACGGTNEEVHKIIMGGPMMGIAGVSLDIPVVKGTSGLLLFSEKYTRHEEELNCIRCGRCVNVCPMKLLPTTLDMYSRRGDIEILIENNILNCMECGSCTYVCPSKRHLVQSIRLGKQRINATRAKEAKK